MKNEQVVLTGMVVGVRKEENVGLLANFPNG